MRQPRAHVALLGILAAILLVNSRPVLADSGCSSSDASVSFSTTLSLPPTSKATLDEIRVAIAQGHFERAEGLLGKIPPGAERSLWEGVLSLHSGKTFASIRSLEEAARLDDSNTIETLLAVDYLLLNQRQLTAQTINKALALNPKDERTVYLRGRFHFLTHNFSKAAQDFSTVLETEPNDYRTLFYLGLSEWRLSKQSHAQEHLQRSVEVVTCNQLRFALAPQTLAELQLQTGNLKGALVNSDLAVNLATQGKGQGDNQEHLSGALLLRGKVKSALGNKREAADDWLRAVHLNPELAEGWYLLARLYQQRGETKMAAEALAHFKQIHDEL